MLQEPGQRPRRHHVRYQLKCSDDIYEAVVISSFGGYKVFGIADDKEALHPVWLWACSCFLCTIQVYLIFALTVNSFNEAQRIDLANETDKIVNCSQMFCILLVQLTVFTELEHCLAVMIFLANPFAWDWLKPVSHPRIRKPMWNKMVLYILSMTALGLKAWTTLLISASCASVILESDSVENVIFNGLANLFLVDVNEHMLSFVKGIFSLQERGKGFHFELHDLDDPAIRETGIERSEWPCEAKLQSWAEWCMYLWDRRKWVWRAGRVVQFLGLMTIYARQLFIVVIAYDSDVLPSARDVCAIQRQARWIGLNLRRWLEGVSPKIMKFCDEHGSGRMGPGEALGILLKYPGWLVPGMLMLAALLVFPQVLRVRYNEGQEDEEGNNTGSHTLLSNNVAVDGEFAEAVSGTDDELHDELTRKVNQLERDFGVFEHGLEERIDTRISRSSNRGDSTVLSHIGKLERDLHRVQAALEENAVKLQTVLHKDLEERCFQLVSQEIERALRGYVTEKQLMLKMHELQDAPMSSSVELRSVVHQTVVQTTSYKKAASSSFVDRAEPDNQVRIEEASAAGNALEVNSKSAAETAYRPQQPSRPPLFTGLQATQLRIPPPLGTINGRAGSPPPVHSLPHQGPRQLSAGNSREPPRRAASMACSSTAAGMSGPPVRSLTASLGPSRPGLSTEPAAQRQQAPRPPMLTQSSNNNSAWPSQPPPGGQSFVGQCQQRLMEPRQQEMQPDGAQRQQQQQEQQPLLRGVQHHSIDVAPSSMFSARTGQAAHSNQSHARPASVDALTPGLAGIGTKGPAAASVRTLSSTARAV